MKVDEENQSLVCSEAVLQTFKTLTNKCEEQKLISVVMKKNIENKLNILLKCLENPNFPQKVKEQMEKLSSALSLKL